MKNGLPSVCLAMKRTKASPGEGSASMSPTIDRTPSSSRQSRSIRCANGAARSRPSASPISALRAVPSTNSLESRERGDVGELREERQRQLVGPLEIVEHEEQWPFLRERLEGRAELVGDERARGLDGQIGRLADGRPARAARRAPARSALAASRAARGAFRSRRIPRRDSGRRWPGAASPARGARLRAARTRPTARARPAPSPGARARRRGASCRRRSRRRGRPCRPARRRTAR